MFIGEAKNIFIVINEEFTELLENRLGLRKLSITYEVIVLDVRPWSGLNKALGPTEEIRRYKFVGIVGPGQYEEIIRRYRPIICVTSFTAVLYCPGLVKQASCASSFTIFCHDGRMPTPSIHSRIKRFFVRHIDADDKNNREIDACPRRSKSAILFEILVSQIKSGVFLIKAGEGAELWQYRFINKKISVDSQDYHRYKRRNRIQTTSNRYILFVDDAVAEAIDWRVLNVDSPVIAEKYYANLRTFFDRVEDLLGVEVVIAAHPNGLHIDNYPEKFGKRKVHFGSTENLIDSAWVIFTHCSTATSFAIFARKKIYNLVTKEIQSSSYYSCIRTMSSSLKSDIVNMESVSNERLSSIDDELNDPSAYEKYIRKYLCSRRGGSFGEAIASIAKGRN